MAGNKNSGRRPLPPEQTKSRKVNIRFRLSDFEKLTETARVISVPLSTWAEDVVVREAAKVLRKSRKNRQANEAVESSTGSPPSPSDFGADDL